MTHDTSAADHQLPTGPTGPGFAAPGQPPAPVQPSGPGAYGPPAPQAGPAPAGYGAQPFPAQPQPYPGQPVPPTGPQPFAPDGRPQDHRWGPDGLVSTPALPPERVGRGAALALLAVPAGALVSGVIWKLGFIAGISSFIVAAVAAVLYLRGSGGRVKKGLPVIAGVIVLGVVVSFFTAVAVDLWGTYPRLDPDLAAQYPTRWGFISENLFYGPLLASYAKEAVMFGLFGVLGAFGTILRLVRVNRAQ